MTSTSLDPCGKIIFTQDSKVDIILGHIGITDGTQFAENFKRKTLPKLPL